MTDVDRKTKNIVVRCLRPYKGYGLPREREEAQPTYLHSMLTSARKIRQIGHQMGVFYSFLDVGFSSVAAPTLWNSL